MKKIFIALSLFCALGLSAENVSQDKAKQIAEDFLRQSRSRAAAVNLSLVYGGETSASRSLGQAPALYVFDNEGQNGFVVVSGDDAAYPILGYSYDGDFPGGQLPANLASWLEGMENQVNYLRKQGAPTMVGSRAEDTGEVVKQLNTAKWDQDTPYNKFCPTVRGKKSPTGCTATALAIVMRHAEWPQTRSVEIPGYKNKTDLVTIASRPGTTYHWDNMLMEYKQGAYTDSQADEVAGLMADVAVMMESNFGSNSTAAAAANAIVAVTEYMGYDKSARLLKRHLYTQSDWYKLMKDELDANRPVFYTGSNSKAGHAFVLDGYTTKDYFGVNWGWSGYCDGYFRLDAMVPTGSGTGGNNDHYNSEQYALVGLKKDEGGEWTNTVTIGVKGFINVPSSFKSGTKFTITLDCMECVGNGYFTGDLLWAVTDKEGTIKEQLLVEKFNKWHVGYRSESQKYNLTIQNPLKVGDRLRLFYKPAGESSWTLIQGGEGCTWEVILKGEIDIDANVSLKYERGSKRLTVKASDDIKVKLFTEDGQDISNRLETAAAGKIINASRFDLGTYVLRLEVDEENYRDVRLKLGVTQ